MVDVYIAVVVTVILLLLIWIVRLEFHSMVKRDVLKSLPVKKDQPRKTRVLEVAPSVEAAAKQMQVIKELGVS